MVRIPWNYEIGPDDGRDRECLGRHNGPTILLMPEAGCYVNSRAGYIKLSNTATLIQAPTKRCNFRIYS